MYIHILFAVSALLFYYSLYFEFYKKKVYPKPSGSIFNTLEGLNPTLIIYGSAIFVATFACELYTILAGQT
jgi:hypothetical protein